MGYIEQNAASRARVLDLVASTSPEVLAAPAEGGWTIAALLAHMATEILGQAQMHPRAYGRWARTACALAYGLTDRAVQEVIRGVRRTGRS